MINPQKLRRPWWSFLCVAALGLALLFGGSCAVFRLGRSSWQPPVLVSLNGVENCAVPYLHGLRFFEPVQKGGAVSVPVRDGDILLSDDKLSVLYQGSDGPSLAISGDKARTMLNGTTVSLDLKQNDALKWLQKATPEQLRGLRLLNIGDALDAQHIAQLRRVAKVNPEVGLWMNHYQAWTRIAGLFDPAWLRTGGDLQEQDRHTLTMKENIRTLAIVAPDSQLKFLAAMAHLKTLIIEHWDPLKTGPLPDNLARVRRIVLIDPVIADLSAIGKQPNLLELNIEEAKSLEDLTLLSRFPKLRLLSLHDTKKVRDLWPLQSLRHVQWLGLPSMTTQGQFLAIIQDHPNLTFLDLSDCEKLSDLSPITHMARLRYLMVPSGHVGPEPLYNMKHLRWLAVLQQKEGQGKGLAKALQKALPAATVVRVVPFCLGSGWILVLMPAVAAAWCTAKRRERRGLFVRGGHG